MKSTSKYYQLTIIDSDYEIELKIKTLSSVGIVTNFCNDFLVARSIIPPFQSLRNAIIMQIYFQIIIRQISGKGEVKFFIDNYLIEFE